MLSVIKLTQKNCNGFIEFAKYYDYVYAYISILGRLVCLIGWWFDKWFSFLWIYVFYLT